MRIINIFIWLTIFIVGSLIVSAIIYPGNPERIKTKILTSISIDSISLLDLINNPEEYEGQEVTFKYKSIISTLGDYDELGRGSGEVYKLYTKEEDGTHVYFPIHYKRRLNIYEYYDLTGIVKKHNSGIYYIELTKVVARD